MCSVNASVLKCGEFVITICAKCGLSLDPSGYAPFGVKGSRVIDC